ncbi:flagellar biosynthetic protein FliO [Angustibacter sp. McL0619]|uniref:flagellar biosynthetic protein FliO n=1 Tax=Angustibacter sp. McL0619 TaxID=3415676 RepID=UPI003CEA87EE
MDFLALAGRVILSLAVVLVLLWLASRGMRRNQRRSSKGVDVDVLARQPLAQRASVAVVKVGDRALVLGVTENRIELLSDQPLEALMLATPVKVEADVQPDGEDWVDADGVPVARGDAGADNTAIASAVRGKRGADVPRGPLAGSALSPATWAKAIDAVREMTVRK